MQATFRLLVIPLTVLLLAACAPESASLPALPQPSITVAASPATPSPTIDWFPVTSTATASVTVPPSPTAIPMPGLGESLYRDDFSSAEAWLRAKSAGDGSNSVIIERNRATLAINFTPGNLSTLQRELVLSNFYAEVAVSVNRCFTTDTYGMIFRAAGDFDSYRFLLNCQGEARAERMRGGVVFPLSDWTASGDIPPGAPGEVRIGVWASGVEMRFFLNGRYQFSVLDPIFRSGTLGFFASSNNPAGLNVSFQDLSVRAVSYLSPTPTATPSRTPTATRTPRP
jgi:hypothetical protein